MGYGLGNAVQEDIFKRLEELERALEVERSKPVLNLNSVDIHELNLQPNSTLIIKLDSDKLESTTLDKIRDYFQEVFPNNKIVVTDIDLEMSVVEESKKSVDTTYNESYSLEMVVSTQ